MATLRQFEIGLYREHLAEASFLDEQRVAHLHDPEVPWPSLSDLDERLEAHIDALIVGGDLALDVCRKQATDPSEIYGALCVFCRRDLEADAVAALKTVDPTDETLVGTASRALRSEAPGGWRDNLLRLLQQEPPLAPVLAHVAGFRRYPAEGVLATALAARPALGRADLAWALGRVGSAFSAPVLTPLLDSDDDRLCQAAGVALLRLGDDHVLERAIAAAPKRPWGRRVLGIGGPPRSVQVLLEALEGTGAEETVLALGLLGDLSAVAPLLELLEHETLGASAAAALNTITGAGLYAEVFVPDRFDPDELFDDERDAYEKDGTVPTRIDGPFGNWVRGPLRDRAGWQEWLGNNKHRFSRNNRWRMGEPYGPSALLACLQCETTPHAVRSASCDELVVRYRMDVPFEVELRAHQQWRFLLKIERWIAAQSSRFDAGRWYFAGQLQG